MKNGTGYGDSNGGSSEYLDFIYIYLTVPDEIHA